jgi:hypothetical protein
MKLSFIFATASGLVAVLYGTSAAEQTTTKPPKEVLQEFIKMELQGARLTPEGRSKTAHLLVRASTAPPDPIDIVSNNFEVPETTVTEDSVKLNLYFPYFYGWLDSSLHFKEALHMAPGNGLIREGINADYALVLTDKHVELGPDRRETKGVRGVQEWRIENTPSFATITLATAIRYVTEMRDKTADPVTKKNADETLAKLKKLH